MNDSTSTTFPGSILAKLFSDPALAARRVTVQAGDVLFQPDTPADSVYYIHRGQVRLYTVGAEDARLIEILGPDEWFGVGALARHRTHESRAVVVVPSVISEVRADRLLSVASHRSEMLLELTRQLAQKLLASRDDAARLVFEDCNARLIRTLLQFSRSAASQPREDGVVLRITHNQLAQAIGVARETVSLALTQLRQQNLLRTGRNQLFFNPDALRNFRNGTKPPLEQVA
jgi:CRP/FNR family transcriptional regulator, cyclic AMP receptor protein